MIQDFYWFLLSFIDQPIVAAAFVLFESMYTSAGYLCVSRFMFHLKSDNALMSVTVREVK